MKKLFKRIGLLFLIIFCASAVYYLYALHQARTYTLEVILHDLQKSQWRNPDGIEHPFEILGRDLSETQKEILIMVQDPGFYQHQGIDLQTPGAGLTTITQAIVKKLYFENFKPGIAKIKQSLIARFVVNDLITKDDQITLFINLVYFGEVEGKSIVGLESAANAYYRRPIHKLTEEQFISLIAMMVMPRTFHLIEHPEWNKDRTNRIKALVAGEYKPTGLMDQFYGKLPREVIEYGLPPASYIGDALNKADPR